MESTELNFKGSFAHNFEEQRFWGFRCRVNENKGNVKNDICEMDGSLGIAHG